jgi:hypothetical protein
MLLICCIIDRKEKDYKNVTPQMELEVGILWFQNILQSILHIGVHGLGFLARIAA